MMADKSFILDISVHPIDSSLAANESETLRPLNKQAIKPKEVQTMLMHVE